MNAHRTNSRSFIVLCKATLCASAALLLLSATARAEPPTNKTIRTYEVPAILLVRDDKTAVALPAEMDDGRPVVLNFIFTTCGSICPVMSSIFARFQKDLGPEASKVHLMSISIDPEQDTPKELAAYSRRYHAGEGWQFYTGTQEASLAAQKAFDVYRGAKMSHTPVTLMRLAPGKPWLRIEGFVKPEEMVRLYHDLFAAPEWARLR